MKQYILVCTIHDIINLVHPSIYLNIPICKVYTNSYHHILVYTSIHYNVLIWPFSSRVSGSQMTQALTEDSKVIQHTETHLRPWDTWSGEPTCQLSGPGLDKEAKKCRWGLGEWRCHWQETWTVGSARYDCFPRICPARSFQKLRAYNL